MRITRTLTLVAACGLLAAACSSDDDDTAATAATVATTDVESSTAPSAVPTDSSAPPSLTEPADTSPVTSDATSESGSPDDADPEGVARLAYDLAAAARGGFTWDPSASTSPVTDIGIYGWVYGTLLRPTGAGELVPELADSVEVIDAQTIEVVVRDGLTLSDGTPVDGQMVKTILETNLAKVDNPAYRPAFYSVTSIDLSDPQTLVLHLPDGTAASWAELFAAGAETVIVPPGTDFDAPIGAGSYVVDSFTPGQTMTLTKNPNYWNADSILVPTIEIIAVPPDNSQAAASALSAGQVDWARLNFEVIDAVGGDAEVISEPDPEFESQVLICKSTTPFDEVKVRQALSMATDRETINQALFRGTGTVAWDLWPEGHPLHNPDLAELYPFDVGTARDLLAEAGVTEITADVIPIPAAGSPEIAQILQQQWAQVGVTLNIVQSTNFVNDLFVDNKAPFGVIPRSGGGRAKLANFTGNATGNLCLYDDPELNALVDELATVTDSSDEGIQLWHDIQQIIVEDALFVPIVFQPLLYGLNSTRLANYDLVTYYTIPVPDMWELYVTA